MTAAAARRSADRPSELDSLVGYQLHLTNLLAMREARTALAALDTTPAKITALFLVRDHPGCDQTTLGRLLAVNRSGAMKVVNTLSERGLVERREGRDRRSNGLFLTLEGDRFLGAVLQALPKAEDFICRILSAAERAELLRLLKKIQAGTAAKPSRFSPPDPNRLQEIHHDQ
jgi:DNA-binding MarR family transcriptional regulator